jgi:hypothetical protein
MKSSCSKKRLGGRKVKLLALKRSRKDTGPPRMPFVDGPKGRWTPSKSPVSRDALGETVDTDWEQESGYNGRIGALLLSNTLLYLEGTD